ncbi:hypothetical protein HDV00_009996 [Rhizophlyctis rosea]|nr:hypothetical protein HDV00_009996 [Rhizophlyctis rosea]
MDGGHLGASEAGTGEASEVENVEAPEVGSVEATNVVSVEATEVGNFEASDVGTAGGSDVKNVKGPKLRNVETSDIGYLKASDVGNTEVSEAGNVQASEIGTVEASKIESGDKRLPLDGNTEGPTAEVGITSPVQGAVDGTTAESHVAVAERKRPDDINILDNMFKAAVRSSATTEAGVVGGITVEETTDLEGSAEVHAATPADQCNGTVSTPSAKGPTPSSSLPPTPPPASNPSSTLPPVEISGSSFVPSPPTDKNNNINEQSIETALIAAMSAWTSVGKRLSGALGNIIIEEGLLRR